MDHVGGLYHRSPFYPLYFYLVMNKFVKGGVTTFCTVGLVAGLGLCFDRRARNRFEGYELNVRNEERIKQLRACTDAPYELRASLVSQLRDYKYELMDWKRGLRFADPPKPSYELNRMVDYCIRHYTPKEALKGGGPKKVYYYY